MKATKIYVIAVCIALLALIRAVDSHSQQRPASVVTDASGHTTSKFWTLKTSESVHPAVRRLLDGKRVSEGMNTIVKDPQGGRIAFRVRNGQITELILADKGGKTQTQVLARRAGGSLGHTANDCLRTYDQCLDGCRAQGGPSEIVCNLHCFWDYIRCMGTVGDREAFGGHIVLY